MTNQDSQYPIHPIHLLHRVPSTQGDYSISDELEIDGKLNKYNETKKGFLFGWVAKKIIPIITGIILIIIGVIYKEEEFLFTPVNKIIIPIITMIIGIIFVIYGAVFVIFGGVFLGSGAFYLHHQAQYEKENTEKQRLLEVYVQRASQESETRQKIVSDFYQRVSDVVRKNSPEGMEKILQDTETVNTFKNNTALLNAEIKIVLRRLNDSDQKVEKWIQELKEVLNDKSDKNQNNKKYQMLQDNLKNYQDGGLLKGTVVRFLYEIKLMGYYNENSYSYPSVINLSGADATNIVLKDAWIPYINLTGAWLNRGNFENADMRFSSLNRAVFQGAILTEANLTGANLTEANLTGANLTESNLATYTTKDKDTNVVIRTNLTKADIAEADLREANLRGANLEFSVTKDKDTNVVIRTNLTKADIAEASLINCSQINDKDTDVVTNLFNCTINDPGTDRVIKTFSGADLTETNLTRANLTGADLTGANLIGANLIGANLKDANLIGANLTNITFDGTKWNNAFYSDETNKKKYRTKFPQDFDAKGKDMINIGKGAKLENQNLRGFNLSNLNLTNAILKNADLREADLTGANLTDTKLKNACYNQNTKGLNDEIKQTMRETTPDDSKKTCTEINNLK